MLVQSVIEAMHAEIHFFITVAVDWHAHGAQALFRRGVARARLGALEDSKADLMSVIKADPRNGGAKKELKVSQNCWAQVLRGRLIVAATQGNWFEYCTRQSRRRHLSRVWIHFCCWRLHSIVALQRREADTCACYYYCCASYDDDSFVPSVCRGLVNPTPTLANNGGRSHGIDYEHRRFLSMGPYSRPHELKVRPRQLSFRRHD